MPGGSGRNIPGDKPMGLTSSGALSSGANYGPRHHTGGDQSNVEAKKLNTRKELKDLALRNAEDKEPDVVKKDKPFVFKTIYDHLFKQKTAGAKKYINYLRNQGAHIPPWLAAFEDEDAPKYLTEEQEQLLNYGWKPTMDLEQQRNLFKNLEMEGDPFAKADAFPMDFKNWNLVMEKNPGLIMRGDLSHFHQMGKPKGAVNPDTGLPFTNTQWETFKRGVMEDRGLTSGEEGKYLNQMKAAQARSGIGGISGGTATASTTTPSLFQQSLTNNTTGAGLPFEDYYVGASPTAANLAWGQQFGVDPRTMGRTTWAEGGRIPAAFGGIMDSSTGRRAYGLGSIFKKIGRAAKKVLKSPIGRGALLAGLGMYAGGLGPWAQGGMWGNARGAGFFNNMMGGSLKNKLFMKNLAEKGEKAVYTGKGEGLDLGKLGIWGTTLAPLIMGGEKEDESSNFDYEDAKTKYWNEIMGIKKGVAQGNLKDLHKWSYLPSNYREGGRIGLYKGGQSIPSDYTIEDAMLSTTHDKLGGITEVMKQADLSRAGDVGQFYAADGGRIGYAGGGDTWQEFLQATDVWVDPTDKDWRDVYYRWLDKQKKAQGGRIEAQEGGLMDLGGMEKDYRETGGFVEIGGEEKADDVPARLSRNEFVMTADAVRGMGEGNIDKGASRMEDLMETLEVKGKRNKGASDMFEVSERLSAVV